MAHNTNIIAVIFLIVIFTKNTSFKNLLRQDRTTVAIILLQYVATPIAPKQHHTHDWIIHSKIFN